MGKSVFIKGKAHYLRPFFLDTGENLEPGDLKSKLDKTGGIYSALIKLPFSNRDDAEEHLNGLGVPTENLFGNLIKKDKSTGEIFYKVTRGHLNPSFEEPLQGPPKVVESDNETLWNEEVLIGNDSDITVKLDVWVGSKATKITWVALRVDELVPYEGNEDEF